MEIKIILAIFGLIIAAIGIVTIIKLGKYAKNQGSELPATEQSTIRKTIILCSCVIAANIMLLIGIFLV